MVRAFDMFSGGGGSSWGAAAAGAQIVGGIDAWAKAGKVYTDNFPDAKFWVERVEDQDPHSICEQIGPIELLLASPECTNHSCARGARPRSEESRDTALQVIRYAKAMCPRWIIIENVVHMRPWARYKELLRELSGLGYNITEHVLSAADFGVPQRRKRLFLLCDNVHMPPPKIPRNRGRKPCVASILDKPGVWSTTPLHSERRANATLERAERAINSLGPNKPFLIVYYGTDGAGGWQALDIPLRTVTTIDRFGLCEPTQHGHSLRMLQPTELAKAMGIGEGFRLEMGSRRDQIKILGNGVCPPVMTAAVKSLIGKISSANT